jgi:WD40 repeat protein
LGPLADVEALIFSADGKALFVGGGLPAIWAPNPPQDVQRAIRLFDVATGRLLVQFGRQPGGVTRLALSPDGKTLASLGVDGSVDLWEALTGTFCRRVRPSDLAPPNAFGAAFSPDGTMLAVCTDEVELWDVARAKLIRRFGKTQFGRTSVAFADNRLLATASNWCDRVQLWEVPSGRLLARLEGSACDNLALASGDQTLAAADTGGLLHLWKLPSGERLRTLRGPPANITALAFSPDGQRIATGDKKGKLRLWDVGGEREPRTLGEHRARVQAVAFSPDGTMVASAGAWERKVKLWDVVTLKQLCPTCGHTGEVLALTYSPDGTLLASGSDDRTVRLWNRADGREVQRLGHTHPVGSIAFSADGKRLLSTGPRVPSDGKGETIGLWEVGSGGEQRALKRPDEQMVLATWSRQGQVVSVDNEGVVRCWDAGTGKEVSAVAVPWKWEGALRVCFSPGGRLIAACTGNTTVHLWDTVGRKELRRLTLGDPEDPGEAVVKVALSERHLAAADANLTLHLRDLATGAELRRIKLQESTAYLAFSASGRLVAVGGAMMRTPVTELIQVFEVATGAEVNRFTTEREIAINSLECLAFSPDGRDLAAGYNDCTILIWDLAGREKAEAVSRRQMDSLWADLASPNAQEAFRAVWRLQGSPAQAVAFLANRLRPADTAAEARLRGWVVDLDHDNFDRRERASHELQQADQFAESVLRRALEADPSAEKKRRVEQLLETLIAKGPSPEWLRTTRALEVLEIVATPEAGRVLEELAKGAPDARLTQEAKIALERLARGDRR